MSSRIFSPFYWGPQGYIIGPSWFGAGLGGGNWRPIPNRTPFGSPGYNQTEDPEPSPRDPCVFENFDCSVYTCRLGVTNTSQSTLEIFQNEFGDYVARQKCFLLLDDFDEYGCRQWDRLQLEKAKLPQGRKTRDLTTASCRPESPRRRRGPTASIVDGPSSSARRY